MRSNDYFVLKVIVNLNKKIFLIISVEVFKRCLKYKDILFLIKRNLS